MTVKPFLCSLDLIGCAMVTYDFEVICMCSEHIYGIWASLWEPNLDPVYLFKSLPKGCCWLKPSQALPNAMDWMQNRAWVPLSIHIIGKDRDHQDTEAQMA